MSSPPKPLRKKAKGRTFQCTGYPDCNMTFTRSEHLARHIRKHTGERPFECVHCARKFSRLDNLRQHKQTVHVHENSIVEYQAERPVLAQNQSHTQDQEQKPLPPLPHQQQQPQSLQQQKPPQEQLVQNGEDLEAAATLMRPTQFRSKHRPRPLNLPTSKSMYNDAPFTVPTPLSSTSKYFTLSPVSLTSQASLIPPTSALPGVQFLSNGGKGDSLSSPYNSSFGLNSQSRHNTPVNAQFDLRTPTSIGFSQDYKSPYDRRSWLSNVLNNSGTDGSPSSISNVSPLSERRLSQHELSTERKVRIESLLNSEERAVKLPHVDTLGISKN